MDAADQIVVLTALEITTIKNVRLFLEVADQLEYDRVEDPAGHQPIRQRRRGSGSPTWRPPSAAPIDGTIVSDGRLAVLAVNRGVPFVVSHPDGALSRDIIKLARTLAGDAGSLPRTSPTSADSSPAAKGKDQTDMSLLKRIERARPAGEGEARTFRAVPADGSRRLRAPRRRAAGAAASAAAARPRRVAPFLGALPARESFREAKYRVQNRLINELDPKLDLTNQVEVRRQIEELFGKIADEEGLALTRAERVRMLEQITDEILGLGPLEPLLRDETITEVMVNGPQQVYIEREGRLELTNVTFQNDEHVMKIIQRIIAPIGRRIDESSPMVDARLADGSRVNAIIPPLVAGRARCSRSGSSRPRRSRSRT